MKLTRDSDGAVLHEWGTTPSSNDGWNEVTGTYRSPNFTLSPSVTPTDTLMESASKPAVTTTDVKPQATPNLNINAFGANPNAHKQTGNMLSAAFTGMGANYAEAGAQASNAQLTIGEQARMAAEGKTTEVERQTAQKEKATASKEALLSKSDELAKKSAEQTALAKEGKGKVGQFMVDLGITGTQLLGDVALGTAVPGLGTLAMGTRAFGGAAKESRDAGATENQQQLYGLASMALSLGVEKLFQVGNAFKRAYGSGFADDVFERLAGKLMKSPAGQNILAGFLSEGSEEAIESMLSPLLKRIYESNAIKQFDTKEAWAEYASDTLYNFLLGGALGAIGGAGNVNAPVETTTEAQNTAPNATAPRVDVEGDTNTPTAQNGAEGVTEGFAANEPITSKMVADMAKDTAQLAQLGIDPNGKSASQLRAEVKAALEQRKAPVETVANNATIPTVTANDVTSADIKEVNSVGAAHPSQLPFSHAESLYGILPESDRAVRPDDVPRSVDGKTRVSQSVVSAKGSPLTSDGFVPILERGTLEGDYSYARLTNNKAVQNAMKFIKRAGSREAAYTDWISTVSRKGMNAERAAEAMLLYNDAQYHGEFAKARKIFTEYQRLERDNARAVQIARLWHEMTPQNQLDILFDQVENLNQELAAANKQKLGSDVPVEEWLTRIGEELATHLEETGNLPDARVKTVAQTIIGDLKHFYNKDSYDKSGDTKSEGKRTEYDRLRDMLNNFGEYLTAFEATKAKLAEDLKDYPEAVAAFTEWVYDLPNIGKRLARELMGETDIQISDDATAAFLNAKTDAEKDAALDVIAAEVAAQIPTSISDILTTLRYTNMLFNLKTTNRNLIGNLAMMASSRLKNAISAGLQRAIPSLENTRSARVSEEYKDIGRAEFEKHKRAVMSQGKYSDATIGAADDFSARVEDLRNKTSNTGNKTVDKILTPLRVSNDATQKLLNNAKFGDEAFLRNHYAFALGGYLQAQGITPEQWNDPKWQEDNQALVDKILGFAAKEAQENTFRDRNEFSDWVASIGRGNSAMPKIVKPVAEGLFPFRRTTANVAKAGFDYSPAGIIGAAVNVGRKSLGDAEFLNPVLNQIQNAFGKKDITANDITDQFAKGLTGTGLMLVGFILAKLGLLRGGEEDDKAQAEFDKQVGRQTYSFEIGDHSITLDWLSPTSMPLFMGAALQQFVADEGLSSKTVGEALLTLTDPMIEMSMLSGLKDSLDGIKYANNNLLQFALDASLNWLFQYMYSTAGGQVERTFEENRMMTYVDKNKNAPSWWQYARGRNAAKGLGEYGQTEYIDAWGNTQSNGSFLGRAFENFISPAYHNKVELTPVEEELQRVYDATGENVLPSLADKKIGDKNLTAEEYTKYATKRGNEMYALMESVIGNTKYKSLTDEQKAVVLSGLKVYANAVGAKAAVPEYTPSAQAVAMLNAEKNGVSPEEYMLFTVYRSIVDKPSKNGNYGSYTKAEKQEAAKRAGLTGNAYTYMTK